MSGGPQPCRLLAWDTSFFGFRIARVTLDRFDADGAAAVASWCRVRSVACAYLLIDLADSASLAAAGAAGPRLVDLRITLDRAAGAAAGSTAASPVRSCRAGDVAALRAIAAEAHRDSRFYADPGFPRERCDELYATWVERSFSGFADAVLVAERDGEPAGYLSCHLDPGGEGRIGLVGVGQASRGQGLAGALVVHGLEWFAAHGAGRVTVVTQGRNVSGLRLYEGCGFKVAVAQAWFHWWFGDRG